MHAPHHAPPEWIERYRGRFDDGWDVWRDRVFARQQVADGIVPADTELTRAPRRHAGVGRPPARGAAALRAPDGGVRRVPLPHRPPDRPGARLPRGAGHPRRHDRAWCCTDNGASAEGGEHGSFNEHSLGHGPGGRLRRRRSPRIDELGGHRAYNHYPWGWAWAGNTPFRMWKRYTWLGGVRTPLIVHWPNGIGPEARGEVRAQFCHAIDLAPTVLDAAGIDVPDVRRRGRPEAARTARACWPSFDRPDAPGRATQYFEMLGSRAIVDGRWKATTDHVSQGVPDEDVLAGQPGLRHRPLGALRPRRRLRRGP